MSRRRLSCLTARRQGDRRARDRGSAARAASSSSVVSKLARIYFLQKSSGIITSAAVYTRHSTSSRQSSTLNGGTLVGGKLDGDTLDGISAARSTAARSTACGTLDGGMRFFGILLGVEDLLAYDRSTFWTTAARSTAVRSTGAALLQTEGGVNILSCSSPSSLDAAPAVITSRRRRVWSDFCVPSGGRLSCTSRRIYLRVASPAVTSIGIIFSMSTARTLPGSHTHPHTAPGERPQASTSTTLK